MKDKVVSTRFEIDIDDKYRARHRKLFTAEEVSMWQTELIKLGFSADEIEKEIPTVKCTVNS